MITSRGFISLGLIILLVIGLTAFGGVGWWAAKHTGVPVQPNEGAITTVETSNAKAIKQPPATIFYGSRAGMEVNILSEDGLDTAHAIIRTEHTRANAIAFCEQYVNEHPATEKCIQDTLATKLQNQVVADCTTGTFSDFFGAQHQYLGANKNRSDITDPPYLIKDLASGEIERYGPSSGYPVNAGIFRSLCPKEAPADFQ